MATLNLLIKFAIPFISLIGICMFFVYKIKMETAFSFALSCGLIVFVALIGGYINLLPLSVCLLYVFGIACFAYYMFRILTKKEAADFIFAPSTIIFVAACAICVLTLGNLKFATHDEFSHWGIMIKEIASLNALPGSSSVIDFIDYPPTTALFMYFFIYSTGFSQSLTYISQAVFALAPLMIFFKNATFKKPISLLAPFAFSAVLMLTFESTFQYLLVDYLIGLYAAALIAIIFSDKFDFANQSVKSALVITPCIIATSFIKTSAIFYGVLACCVIVYKVMQANKQSGKRLSNDNIGKLFIVLSSPLWAWFLLQKNTAMLFGKSQYASARFALVPENLTSNYNKKPPEFRIAILEDSFLSLFTNKQALCALVALAVCGIIIFLFIKFKKARPTLLINITIISAISFFVYYAGYVFSLIFMFPYEELKAFNTTTIAISRYVSSASGACLGMCFFGIADALHQLKPMGHIKKTIAALAIALMFIPFINIPTKRDDFPEYNQQQIDKIDAFAQQNPFGREDRLLVYSADYSDTRRDCSYNNYIYSRCFLNKNIANFCNTTLNGEPYNYNDYKLKYRFINSDFLVIIEPSPVLYDILAAANITMDTPGGNVYEVDVLDNGEIALLKVK